MEKAKHNSWHIAIMTNTVVSIENGFFFARQCADVSKALSTELLLHSAVYYPNLITRLCH